MGEGSNRWRGLWLGVVLTLGLWLVYSSSARFIAGSDVYPARFIPVSLVTEGNYDLNEFHFIRGPKGDGGCPGGQLFSDPGKPYDGRVLSYYPTLVATLIAPFYWIPFGLLRLSPEHFLVFYLDKAFASLFAALSTCFLLYALREVKTPRGTALAIVIAYGLGTSTWAISAQSLWQHGPSQCFLALSLWLWLRSDRTGRGFFTLGLATGLAVGARQTDGIWAILLFLDIASRQRWKGLLLYTLGGLPSFFFLFFYNWTVFGKPWISGYKFNPVQVYVPDWLALKNLPAGGLGLLFSPSLGLFPNAPFYLLLPIAIWAALRHPLAGVTGRGGARWAHAFATRRYILIPAAFVLLHWLLYGSYREWWAGYSFCYRYMTDALPFLSFLLAGLWRIRLPGTLPASRAIARGLLWSIFFAFTLVGVVVQAFGAYCWSGNWFYNWESINQQLFLDFKHEVPGTIFNHPSVIWSLDPDKHYILCERQWFKWAPERWLVTPSKFHHDLFVKQRIPYGPDAPIILGIGEP